MKTFGILVLTLTLGAAGAAQAAPAYRTLLRLGSADITLPAVPGPEPVRASAARGAAKSSDLRGLPGRGQNVLGEDGLDSRIVAMQAYRQVLGALREMNVQVLESPDGGVFQYNVTNPSGFGAATKFGYLIEYAGPELVLERFSPPVTAMLPWQAQALKDAMQRHGAREISGGQHHLKFIRYRSRPAILYTYDLANSSYDAENLKNRVAANLRNSGCEVVFDNVYNREYNLDGQLHREFHVNVVYLKVID